MSLTTKPTGATIGGQTEPPETVSGVLLDRYAGYHDVVCPFCNHLGADLWVAPDGEAAATVCLGCDRPNHHGREAEARGLV